MSIINLINLQFGIKLSQAEWDSGLLSKERCAQLGVRSPKLSKALTALGMPTERVAMLLSGKSIKSGGVTQVWGEDRYTDALYDQGNSIHYSSCQATDSGAKWFQDSNHGPEYNEIAGDRKFWGESLFIWAVGQPMSWDGEGFKARAKLRVCYNKDNKEVAGLYIDRPYGQYNLLLDNISQLNHWWDTYSKERGYPITPLLMAPLWQRNDGGGSDFQSEYGGRYERLLWVPSYSSGYQDTLSGGHGGLYDFFIDVSTSTPLTVRAYKAREPQGYLTDTGHIRYKVRQQFVKEVTFNPQKGLSKLKAYEPNKRSDNAREMGKLWVEMWGYPLTKLNHQGNSVMSDNKKVMGGCGSYQFLEDNKHFLSVNTRRPYVTREVMQDFLEKGYQKGLPLYLGKVEQLVSQLVNLNTTEEVCINLEGASLGKYNNPYGGEQLGFVNAVRSSRVAIYTFYLEDEPEECNCLTIEQNIEAIGFAKAEKLPYKYENNCLTVIQNQEGFEAAWHLKDVIDGTYIPF